MTDINSLCIFFIFPFSYLERFYFLNSISHHNHLTKRKIVFQDFSRNSSARMFIICFRLFYAFICHVTQKCWAFAARHTPRLYFIIRCVEISLALLFHSMMSYLSCLMSYCVNTFHNTSNCQDIYH